MSFRTDCVPREDACGRGLPLDTGDRRLALFVLHLAHGGRHPKHDLIRRLSDRIADPSGKRRRISPPGVEAKARAAHVVDLLCATGRLVPDGRGCVAPGRDAAFEADLASGANGMEAAGRAVARLHFDDPDDVAKAAAFHAAVRRLYGLHAVGVPGAGAVLVPASVAVVGGRILAASACAVVVDGGRVGIVDDAGPDFALRMEPDGEEGWRVGARMDVAAAARRLVSDPVVDAMPVISVSGWGRSRSLLPERVAKALSSCLRVPREAFEAWMGGPVPDPVWAGISVSLRKGEKTRKGQVLQRLVCRLLEPEARRAALRHCRADLALYSFFHGPDARTGLWRRQASEAFPVLAGLLPGIADAVDAGDPPARALSLSIGVPEVRLRELHGVTWRRAGVGIQKCVAAEDGDAFGVLACGLGSVPPSVALDVVVRWNAGRDDDAGEGWSKGLTVLGRAVDETYGGRLPESMSSAFARDPETFMDLLVSHGMRDATAIPAGRIDVLAGGGAEGRRHVGPAARVVAAAALGPGGSLKRWRRHGELFHRNLGAVNAALAAEASRLSEEAGRAFVPWTPTVGDWECPDGRIAWLATWEALRDEGAAMDHCVEGYFPSVGIGRSCIGSVRGRNGSRATVEMSVLDEDGVLMRVRQLRAVRNDDPDPVCEAVVEDFRRAVADRRVVPDREASAEAAANNAPLVLTISPFGRVAAADPELALRLVAPILPPGLAGATLGDIRRLVAEEDGKSPPGRLRRFQAGEFGDFGFI